MKIFIDTSYFLPLIKISIDGISEQILLELLLNSKNEKCKIIKRKGKVMIICENPKHKQRQG